MRLQSRLPVSSAALMVTRNLPRVTFHLVQRVSMLAQPLLLLSSDFAVESMVQHTMQAWWEHLWPNQSIQERLHLYTFADKQCTVTLRALLNLACAALTLLGCPLSGSRQEKATLCQR